jgi:hypothetical protein
MLLCCLFFGGEQQLFAADRSYSDPSVDCNIAICQVTPSQSYAQHSSDNHVTEFVTGLLDTKDWPARWQCGTWTSFHGWLYIISDIIIWFSYFMIPLTLGYFVYRRKREPIPFRSIIFLFIAFILACGLTHLVDAAIFWWPAYRLSAAIRFITAVVSLGTVVALVKIAPQVVVLKSPDTLEQMVDERTKELTGVNTRLHEERLFEGRRSRGSCSCSIMNWSNKPGISRT